MNVVLFELWLRMRMRERIIIAAYVVLEVLCESYAPHAPHDKCEKFFFFANRGGGEMVQEKWVV